MTLNSSVLASSRDFPRRSLISALTIIKSAKRNCFFRSVSATYICTESPCPSCQLDMVEQQLGQTLALLIEALFRLFPFPLRLNGERLGRRALAQVAMLRAA